MCAVAGEAEPNTRSHHVGCGRHSSITPLEIEFDNTAERDCTVITVEGRGQGDALLAALSSGLQQFGVNVSSAAQQSEDGKVLNVFKVTQSDGSKVSQVCRVWVRAYMRAHLY